jgi:hypothetical protein
MATESDIRAQASALCLDQPLFTAHEAPEAFTRWALQIELVAMLESRSIYMRNEVDEANRLARASIMEAAQ